ncbi:hypothetical protein RFI_01893 [Reticulomyxa filosa]|uniref:Uncharacterized protein n=1 Tax=Reticulomyxa filosa TaxID=46433 RepID=X6PAJ7_RETFI|nr:hypothetical protein RFI_01893 [Reticulomyxa filosa]|eukprot:ETO35181.1 hypothetical protein RFI_01893 [Reticulomyxa filosa]
MTLFEASVVAEGKLYTIMLSVLTLEHLKKQILQVTLPTHANDVLEAIIDINGNHIQTDESVIDAFKKDPVYFTAQFQSKDISKENEGKKSQIKDYEISEALDFKMHWSRNWRKSNTEAAKTVEQMIRDKEQGLIIVAFNTLQWKNRNDNLVSIIRLVNSEKEDIKEFNDYCMYVIKRKSVILEEVNIDGIIYAVDCKIECKGCVNVTTQIFVTKDAIVDEQLKQSISPIVWNTKIHYGIPIQFQDLEKKEEECTKQKLFDKSIIHLQKYLQIANSIFGLNHHYVAVACNMIGSIYHYKGLSEKAVTFFKRALKIASNIFGNNCSFVAQMHENVGRTYSEKGSHLRAIKYHMESLKIKLKIFKTNHIDISWSYVNLGNAYKRKNKYDKAIQYYEMGLKIRLEIYGNNHATVSNIYKNLGDAYQCSGNHDKAIEYHENALQVRLNIFGKVDVYVAYSYTSLGIDYEKKESYDKAIECYENALMIKKTIFGSTHKEVADSIWNLGLTLAKSGNNKIAQCYVEEAWKICSIVLGDWAKETLQVKEKMKNLGD